MFKYLFIILVVLMLIITPENLIGAEPVFSDITPDHWAYQSIIDLHKKNIIQGFPSSDRFKGRKPLSRNQMAVLLNRLVDKLNEDGQSALDKFSYKTLKQFEMLISEFHGEISSLRQEFTEVKKKVVKIDKNVKKIDFRVTELESYRIREGELKEEIRRVNRKSNNRFLMMLLISAGLATQL